MKKFFTAGAVLSIAALLCACASEQAQKTLDEHVKETVSQLPVAVPGNMMKISDVTYNGDNLEYTVNTGGSIRVSKLRQMGDAVAPLVMEALKQNADSAVQAQLEICRQAGARIVVHLKDASDSTYTLTLEP